MVNKFSIVGLAAGISTLLLTIISLFVPWWQLKAGSVQVSFSPVNFNLQVSGASVPIPLIFALNISCLLILLAGSTVLVVYSLKPSQSYSKRLVDFGYKQLLIVFIIFVAVLIAFPLILQSMVGVSFPLSGAATITLPQQLVSNGPAQTVNASASISWTFFLAIAATALGVAARVMHRRVASNPLPPPPAPSQMANQPL